MKNTKINRNEPCPCGSGKKYKRCCSDDTETSYSESRFSTIVQIGIFFEKSQTRYFSWKCPEFSNFSSCEDYSAHNEADLQKRISTKQILMLNFKIPEQEKQAYKLLENWSENIVRIDETQHARFESIKDAEEIIEIVDRDGSVVTDVIDGKHNNLISTRIVYSKPSIMVVYINSEPNVIPPHQNIRHTLGELKTTISASRCAPQGLEPDLDDEYSTYAVCTVEPMLLDQHRNCSETEREILTELFRSPYFISDYFKRVIFGSEDEWQLIPKEHLDNLLWCCSDKFNSEDLLAPITFRVSVSRKKFFNAFGESYLKKLYQEDGLDGFLRELGVQFLPQGIMRKGCIPDPYLKSNISNLLNFLNEDPDVINSFLAEFDEDIIMTYSMNKMIDVDRIIDIYGTKGYTPSQYDNAEKVSEWMSVYRPVLSKRDLVDLN
jgi:hypothetical protein